MTSIPTPRAVIHSIRRTCVTLAAFASILAPCVAYAEAQGFLETLHRNTTLINTVPDNNGD